MNPGPELANGSNEESPQANQSEPQSHLQSGGGIQAENQPIKAPSSSNKLVIILVIVVLLVLAGGGGFFGWRKYEEKKEKDQATAYVVSAVPDFNATVESLNGTFAEAEDLKLEDDVTLFVKKLETERDKISETATVLEQNQQKISQLTGNELTMECNQKIDEFYSAAPALMDKYLKIMDYQLSFYKGLDKALKKQEELAAEIQVAIGTDDMTKMIDVLKIEKQVFMELNNDINAVTVPEELTAAHQEFVAFNQKEIEMLDRAVIKYEAGDMEGMLAALEEWAGTAPEQETIQNKIEDGQKGLYSNYQEELTSLEKKAFAVKDELSREGTLLEIPAGQVTEITIKSWELAIDLGE